MLNLKLPKFLIPKKKTNLKRFGSFYDGGYVLNEIDIIKSDILISLGIHENWDFEEEIYKNYNLKKIICFDPETSNSLIFLYLVKSFLKFDRYKIATYLKKFKKFKELKSYSTFYKTKFSKDFVLKELKEKNIILKVDIENDEYECLDLFLEIQENLNSLIIEFHDVNKNLAIIKKFISLFKLHLIHTHVNTYSKIENIVLELTFSKNSVFSDTKWNQNDLLNIDNPNYIKHKNIKITYEK
jgi:hypothetical protein